MLCLLFGVLSCERSEAARERTGANGQASAPLLVFAAASTSLLVQRAAEGFRASSGIAVELSLASSGKLARQLAAGAPADLFISASEHWMRFARERGLVEQSAVLASNRLVLIAPADSRLPTTSLKPGAAFPRGFEGRLAIGEPSHVPVGRYASEALDWLGWQGALVGRLLPAPSASSVLRVVELGEVELGIAYRTDATHSSRVKTLALFPEAAHSPITYYVGLVRGRSAAAADLYQSLLGAEARAEFQRLGFVVRAE